MSIATGDYPVFAGERQVGTVTVSQKGLMTVFDARCQYHSREVLRLAAVCAGRYVPLGVMLPEEGALRLQRSFSKNTLSALGYDGAESYRLIRAGETLAQPADLPAPADAPPPENAPAEDPPSGELAAQLLSALLEMTSHKDAAEPDRDIPDDTTPAPAPEDGWRRPEDPAALFADPDIAAACRDLTDALVSEEDGSLLLAVPVSPDEPFPMMPVFCFGSPRRIRDGEYIVFKVRNGYLTV